jgi:2-aminoadipate transaminase
MVPEQRLSQRAHWAGGEPIASMLMAKTLGHPHLISLAAGFVDQELLPLEATRQAMEAVWSQPGLARAALQYGTAIGHPPLRQAVLDRMLRADGRSAAELAASIDSVVITAGSHQLLFLVSDVLCDPGDIVICAAPSYYVYLGTLANLGVRAAGVETDRFGVIPEAVADELARRKTAGELGRVKAIYITSYYDNPSGATVPLERRAALVEVAKRWSQGHKIYLIEDAAYRELRYAGEDAPSLRAFDPEGDVVVHAGTFSKSFSPGIRVGWGVLPPALRGAVLAEKGNVDFGSPHFNQVLMATVLERGLFEPQLVRLRAGYREKIDACLRAADDVLAPIGGIDWARPQGGLYVWLRLPESVDTGLSGPLFARALAEGVLYVPGEYCYPPEGRPRPRNMLRLSFGAVTCRELVRGVRAWAGAIRQVVH